MSRIADKHGLTNKYRDGSKRLVKRGRPRKYLFGYSKPKAKRSKCSHHTPNVPVVELTPQQTRAGCLIIVCLIILLVAFVIAIANGIGSSKKLIDYTEIQKPGHPVLYDDYNMVIKYYRGYSNVSVGSYQVHPEVDKPVITALSYLDYDKIYLITINLDNIDEKLTFNSVLDLAVQYIPSQMIIENFDYEKAIYKIKSDGTKQYECYYVRKKKGVEKPGYYFDGTDWIKLKNGFSIVIQEKIDGNFVIEIGDDWYANVYDPKPIGGIGPSKEELESHCAWDFRIEQYINP